MALGLRLILGAATDLISRLPFGIGPLLAALTGPFDEVLLWSDPTVSDTKAALLEAFVRREIALVDRSPLPSARA